MNRRHGLFGTWAHGLSLLSIIFAAVLLICGTAARAGSASVTVGGPFTLTGPDGTTVTDQTYRGKWLLIFFGYTFCPDTCPTTLNEIATALEKLGPDAQRLQPLFISVDPERDTPEIMKRYTAAFDARIVGLVGSPQQIAAIAEEYGAYGAAHPHKAGTQDYPVDHSTYIYLMDPQGKFVRGFDAETPGYRIADTMRSIMAQ
jgi:protein SCO1